LKILISWKTNYIIYYVGIKSFSIVIKVTLFVDNFITKKQI